MEAECRTLRRRGGLRRGGQASHQYSEKEKNTYLTSEFSLNGAATFGCIIDQMRKKERKTVSWKFWGPRVSWHQLYRQSDNSHFGSCRSDTSAFTERSSHIWVSPCLSSCILCLRPLTSPHLAHHSLVRFPASLAFGRASGLGNLTNHSQPLFCVFQTKE